MPERKPNAEGVECARFDRQLRRFLQPSSFSARRYSVITEKRAWILAVEDSDNDMYLLQRVLDEDAGPRDIVRARNGEQAIELIRDVAKGMIQSPPDFIVIDLNLPRINGFEVLEHLDAQEALHAVPVIVMTSSNQEEDLTKALRSGADAYFVKPLDPSSYRNLMKSINQARLVRSDKLTRPDP
jgi:CheY-like chemotaxis protein